MPDVIRMLPKQVINVVPAGAGVAEMKEEYGRSLQILLAVCGLVLLIACANVANLLLARAVARRAQTALRLALGATRRQIVTQALIESVLLAIGGGIAGLVVAIAAARLLLALAFHGAHFLPISAAPSPLVLAFAFLLALLTGIIFGAAPAWFATRTDPAEALRGSGRGTSDHSSFARKALLVVQATLSVVLVAGATMLARSLNKLEHQDFGYQVQGRVVVVAAKSACDLHAAEIAGALSAAGGAARPPARRARLRAGAVQPAHRQLGRADLVAGHPAPKMSEEGGASWDRVSANYLQNFGMPVLRGRGFTPADNETTAPVAVVNEAFVKRFFKSDEDPLDQHFGLDLPENADTFRIVGVVRDAKFAGWGLNRPARPMFYVPLAQNVDYKHELLQKIELRSHFIGGIMLVTDLPPGTLEPLLTRALAEVDPNLTITSVRTMQQQVALSFDQERAVASLAGLFGMVALLLAAVGLYGVTAYTVAQRTNEIGIRMALGADRATVVRLVLRGAFRRVLVGLALGVPLAIGAGAPDLREVVRRFPLGPGRARGCRRSARHLRVVRRDRSREPRRLDFADESAADGVAPDLSAGSDSPHPGELAFVHRTEAQGPQSFLHLRRVGRAGQANIHLGPRQDKAVTIGRGGNAFTGRSSARVQKLSPTGGRKGNHARPSHGRYSRKDIDFGARVGGVVPEVYDVDVAAGSQLGNEPPVVRRDGEKSHPPSISKRARRVENTRRNRFVPKTEEQHVRIIQMQGA